MKTKFGVRLPVSGPLASSVNILKIGQMADELGYDAITTHDHVSHSYNERYHNAGGVAEMVDERDKQGLPVTNFYESIATLSVLAGKTHHVRLIPCSAVLPWRYPVLFAKQISTLYELSGGRYVCCVCMGNIESDFNAMNLEYKKRGKMLNEYLQVLKLIFSSDKQVTFDGEFIKFPLSEFYPKPSGKIPIWIGGYFNDKAFERVANFGDGFLPSGSPETYRTGLPKLREYLRSRGKDLMSLEVGTQTFMCMMKDGDEAKKRSRYTIESFFSGKEFDAPDRNNPERTVRDVLMAGSLNGAFVGSPDQVIKKIEEFAAEGVKFFDIRQINRTIDDVMEMITLFAKEVMPSFN
ncbi:MAG: LLM class flavin-dependent oxidoreductase [Thaumarchaeota archaeon]|nr:LLM class flavin-dependent oxidoreductase [Nitrososphaerota archaeon]